MTGYDEERLAELLRRLAPAPRAWVQAAQELPAARAVIDQIAVRAEEDEAFRARVLADLESALEAAGVEAIPSVVGALRARLVAG
jgi:hypothetical protein